jgi:hypothetical protein
MTPWWRTVMATTASVPPTVVLYLAISLGFQRIIVQQRARRLQPGGPPAFGRIERPS